MIEMVRYSSRPWIWVEAFGAGAIAGVLAEILVLRMNPEITQTLNSIFFGLPLWASWGMFGAGVPILLGLFLLERVRPQPKRWLDPVLFSLVYFLAAILSRVNAELHPRLLQGSAHRVMAQDAVAWLVVALLALVSGGVVRRLGGSRLLRLAFLAVMLVLPIVRVLMDPTPPRHPLEITARPLGESSRSLLVIGIEGLDSKVLVVDAAGDHYPALAQLIEFGAWGPMVPHRPYLRWALWTSAATGTYPGRHGVKAHWGWNLPLLFPETLRLLPWTPQGSRGILPWWMAQRVPPPQSSVAPLWARLRSSGLDTSVVAWPGAWGDDPSIIYPPDGGAVLEATMGAALEAALEPFPEKRSHIWAAIVGDQVRVDTARSAIESGVENVWVHLQTLALARRYHEPLRLRDTQERQLLNLVMELLDQQLTTLLAGLDENTLVALVSPYGLGPPGSLEKARRLLGGGGTWRVSADSCPEGLFLVMGDGVQKGRRFAVSRPPDVAPTLCYLLGLPVAQYMEGGVIVEAAEQEYIAEHPLRVVD